MIRKFLNFQDYGEFIMCLAVLGGITGFRCSKTRSDEQELGIWEGI